MTFERVCIKFKPRCAFVGAFFYRDPISYRAAMTTVPLPFWWWHVYICLIPCLPLVIIFRTARKPKDGGRATFHRLHEAR